MRGPARPAAVFGLLAGTGCAAVVVESADVCIYSRAPVDVAPSALPCHVVWLNQESAVPAGDYELRYTCMSSDTGSACAQPEAAVPALQECMNFERANGHDAKCGFSGETGHCEKGTVYSACGAEPTTVGGCCYDVYFVVSEFWT